MNYYGKYRATVVNTNDPDGCGRIQFECPTVLGKNISSWAFPCLPPNTLSLPRVGDLVWVEFEGGNRDEPIWVGVFYTPKQRLDRFGSPYKPKDIIVKAQGEYKLFQNDIDRRI